MKNKRNQGIARFALCASMSAVLAACGGGGSAGTSSGPATAAATSMSGTVAIGRALAGAPVTVTDANGKTSSATSDANGAYSISISGLAAPFLITAVDRSGVAGTLYSVVANTSTPDGTPVTANVTPLTTAVAALITKSGNPLDLAQSGGLSAVTPSAVGTAITTLDAAIAPILSANSLAAASFDPIGGAFTPNQAGADAVIDSVAVTPSARSGGYQITSLADPDTAIQLNSATAVTAALAAPPQPANYLAPLLAQLAQCMAGPADASAPACATAIDSHYLRYGTNFQTGHTIVGTGTTLNGVKTVAFLPAGTLPGINNPAALVYFLVTDPDGTPDFGTDVVQQLPDGTWDIIGNQEQYNIYIASFLGRTQYTNAADANNGHYESGLDIQIPQLLTVNGNPVLVGSARVQGPGLPANGLWMQSPGAGIGSHLTIPTGNLSAPVSGAQVVNGGMATTYKWSWAPLSGNAMSFSPDSAPEYAPSVQDVSTIQNYGVYTVTLYDTTGTQIVSEKVLNVAPNFAAAAGSTVAWQTLGSDVIATYLTPGGSGTSVTGNATAHLDWTVPGTAVYPNFWASINSLGAPIMSGGVLTTPAQTYDADFYTQPDAKAPTSVTFTAPFVDTLSGSPAAQAVQVQLNWQAGGDFYINTWQYDN